MAKDQSHRPHLGAGFPFPIRPRNGRLSYVRDEEAVEQAIGVILETVRRERVMVPSFGSGLRNFLFAPNGAITRTQVEADVKRALVDWEPRIDVERVTARSSPDTPNLLLIEIDYVVRSNSAFYNRVYPFYLTQPGS
jgi:hypothetical protein